jgi:hypothetical protein
VTAVRPLFQIRNWALSDRGSYDVSPDGQRFLVNTSSENAASAPLALVVNWPALMEQ